MAGISTARQPHVLVARHLWRAQCPECDPIRRSLRCRRFVTRCARTSYSHASPCAPPDTKMRRCGSMHRSRDPHASSAYPCAARTIESRSRTPARAQHAPHRRFSHECSCGREVEVSRTIKWYPTDVGGRWLAAIVLRHRRRPEEASKQYPGEAPYTNRGLRHVGEAPPTNRGSAT